MRPWIAALRFYGVSTSGSRWEIGDARGTYDDYAIKGQVKPTTLDVSRPVELRHFEVVVVFDQLRDATRLAVAAVLIARVGVLHVSNSSMAAQGRWMGLG